MKLITELETPFLLWLVESMGCTRVQSLIFLGIGHTPWKGHVKACPRLLRADTVLATRDSPHFGEGPVSPARIRGSRMFSVTKSFLTG